MASAGPPEGLGTWTTRGGSRFPEGAARLHRIVATLRSVETGRPRLRVTDSGYSARILPDGQVRDVTRGGESVAKTIAVPILAQRSTLRTRCGEWFAPTSLALGLLALVRTARADARNRKPHDVR